MLVVSVHAECPTLLTTTRLSRALKRWLRAGVEPAGSEDCAAAAADVTAERQQSAAQLCRQLHQHAQAHGHDAKNVCDLLQIALRARMPGLVLDVLQHIVHKWDCNVFAHQSVSTAGLLTSAWGGLSVAEQQSMSEAICRHPLSSVFLSGHTTQNMHMRRKVLVFSATCSSIIVVYVSH